MSRAQCECLCAYMSIQEFVCGNVCMLYKVICMECRKLRVKDNKGNWVYVSICCTQANRFTQATHKYMTESWLDCKGCVTYCR